MKIFFSIHIWMVIVFAAQGCAMENSTWKGSLPDGFTASITPSPLALSIQENLIIEIVLTYPEAYHPNLNMMIQHLFNYDGFSPSPFSLEEKVIEMPKKLAKSILEQHIKLTLSAQISGKHYIAFQSIPFASNTSEANTQKLLFTEVFEVNVTVPQTEFRPSSLIAPLMSLSQKLPVDLTFANHRKFIDNLHQSIIETAHDLSIVRSKSLPWKVVLALTYILILIFIIRRKVT